MPILCNFIFPVFSHKIFLKTCYILHMYSTFEIIFIFFYRMHICHQSLEHTLSMILTWHDQVSWDFQNCLASLEYHITNRFASSYWLNIQGTPPFSTHSEGLRTNQIIVLREKYYKRLAYVNQVFYISTFKHSFPLKHWGLKIVLIDFNLTNFAACLSDVLSKKTF